MDAMFSNPFGSFIKNLVNHGCQLQGGIAGAFGKSRATRIWFALRDGNRFKNMFVSSNSCCSFGDIPYRLQGGMCIDQMQQYIAQGGNTKTGYAKKIAQPNLNFNTMLNNGSYVSKQRGRRTRKQNDTKQIALMFGGWHLPFSPCHQFSKMWDHEGLRLQDLRHFFHLWTGSMTQLFVKPHSVAGKKAGRRTLHYKTPENMMMMMMMNDGWWMRNDE